MQNMSRAEVGLRSDLDRIVRRVRDALNCYPAVPTHDQRTAATAEALIQDMLVDLEALDSTTTAMERLAGTTSDGLLLAGATRVSVRLLSDLLATLTAELDCRDGAA